MRWRNAGYPLDFPANSKYIARDVSLGHFGPAN